MGIAFGEHPNRNIYFCNVTRDTEKVALLSFSIPTLSPTTRKF